MRMIKFGLAQGFIGLLPENRHKSFWPRLFKSKQTENVIDAYSRLSVYLDNSKKKDTS